MKTRLLKQKITVHVVIFAVVLCLLISRVSPRENFHFDIYGYFIIENITKCTKLSHCKLIFPPSQKSWTYLYAKYMAYTVVEKHAIKFVGPAW